MAQKADGKQKGNDRVTFTRAAADRIANVVLEVEGGGRDTGPLEFGYRGGGSVNAKTFRIASFSGSWSTSTSKTVTFLNGTTGTASVTNLFLELPNAGQSTCAVAKEGTSWYLVQALKTQSTQATALVTVLTGVTLSTAGLEFTRANVVVLSTATASTIVIGTTACA